MSFLTGSEYTYVSYLIHTVLDAMRSFRYPDNLSDCVEKNVVIQNKTFTSLVNVNSVTTCNIK